MNSGFRCFVPLALLLATLAASHTGMAKDPPQAETSEQSVSSRIANVERLIGTSSAARRIESTGNEDAMRRKSEASGLLEQARVAARAGKLEEANRLLDKSTRLIFEAIHLLGPAPEGLEKKERDFTKRAESVEVLLTALERIGAEKDLGAQSSATAGEIRAQLARARSLTEAGDVDQGTLLLGSAYEKAKLAVEDLREGDTVVRTLSFETVEDEYRYEIDRNDTHQMLIKILLEEKRKSERVDATVREFIERSRALRSQAENEARGGDYRAAVGTLESSTKELLRAIRSAGVYIPS